MTLYIVRLTRTNNVIDSRPCIDCYNKLTKLGIRKIVYSVTPTTYVSIKLMDYVPNKRSEGDDYYQEII